jgi:hypothetical protein
MSIVLIGLPFGLLTSLKNGLTSGLSSGLYIGVLGGLSFGGSFVISNFALRILLYRYGYTPWDYVGFLEFATGRIFLHKVGGGYIFIHRLLMEHFAEMDKDRIETLARGISLYSH